jgi:hypothetical protein
MIMMPKLECGFAIAVSFLTSHSLVSPSEAQAPIYVAVNSDDLLGGYIPDGEWIEVTGHSWFSDKGEARLGLSAHDEAIESPD